MAKARKYMTEWVREALSQLGGKASMLEVARRVWEAHEADIRADGNLLYEWQYELRWAASFLRRDGALRPANQTPKGMLELSKPLATPVNVS